MNQVKLTTATPDGGTAIVTVEWDSDPVYVVGILMDLGSQRGLNALADAIENDQEVVTF
ncbi:hypothetical protein ACFXG4_23465 [Nocardia sp. NPDC059246]|uniref:hypothetical protein n=1 Tax=unclassified Nocardia TaxID=2637762 RepID=UPI00369116A1